MESEKFSGYMQLSNVRIRIIFHSAEKQASGIYHGSVISLTAMLFDPGSRGFCRGRRGDFNMGIRKMPNIGYEVVRTGPAQDML